MALRDVLPTLDEVLVPRGFVRRKRTYYRRQEDNRVALHFASPGADPDFFAFTAHLGVQSARISAVLGPALADAVPAVNGIHHWFRWAGDLNIETQPDSPWAVQRGGSAWALEEALSDLQSVVIPALDAHGTDVGLRDGWLARPDTWLTEARQLAYLVVLLREIGPSDGLDRTEHRLRRLTDCGDREADDLARRLALSSG